MTQQIRSNLGRTLLPLLGACLIQAGCAGAMSTGASMQIDVEVYKGPLSMEPAAQWGELKGILEVAKSSFQFIDKNSESLLR